MIATFGSSFKHAIPFTNKASQSHGRSLVTQERQLFHEVGKSLAASSSHVMQQPVRFGASTGATGQLMTQLMNGVADSLYNRGEGVRYAVEQTFGYTIPRFVQQQYRTFDITGEKNKQAGEEMFIRDTAADFTDTFLPGLLATYAVGRFLDKRHGSLVQHNIDKESLNVYRAVAQTSTNQQTFFNTLNTLIHPQAHPVASPSHPKVDLHPHVEKLLAWEHTLANRSGARVHHALQSLLGKVQDPYTEVAQDIAAGLKLPSLELQLKHPTTGELVETTIPHVLHDLTRLARHLGHQWDTSLAKMTEKTLQHQPWQGVGTLAAFSISLMIPHWIRQVMVKRYGPQADTNPATRAISEHYDKLANALKKNQPSSTASAQVPSSRTSHGISRVPAMMVTSSFMGSAASQPLTVVPLSAQQVVSQGSSSTQTMPQVPARFGETLQPHASSSSSSSSETQKSSPSTSSTKVKWFPYVRESLKQGNVAPAAISAGFFTFLGAVAGRHFLERQAGKWSFNMAKGMREFLTFERTFPFTTLRQMEFTYGALCGIRLMESRNDADFRETLLRDNILGFPTLTWGTQWLRQGLSHLANQQLVHSLVRDGMLTFEQSKTAAKQLLFKTPHGGAMVRRDAQDITLPMMKQALALSEEQLKHLPDLVARVKSTQNRVTLSSAAISVALLAFLEPQLGIWVTNSLEKRRQREKLGILAVEPPHFSSRLSGTAPSGRLVTQA